MAAIKRKATSSDGEFRTAKLPKTDDNPVTNTSCTMRVVDGANDLSDEYRPRNDGDDAEMSEMCDSSAMSQHVSRATQRRVHRAVPTASHDMKQHLLDEQVTFIILMRDNNKPDPYGEHSSTHGPLPWPAVAQLYSKKFRIHQSAVGGAAMEKRARQRREVWMAARPDYPRKIVYAEKVKIAKPKVARGKQVVPVTQMAHRSKCPRQGENKAARGDTKVIEVGHTPKSMHTSLHVGGWMPPDDVRNRADLSNYFHHPTLAAHNEILEWETIDGVDFDEQPCGRVQIPVQDICKTSALIARELEHTADILITLSCSSKAAVDRYVQCISPLQLTSLPDWDISSLTDMYAIATRLEDDHVRSLILKRWRDMFQHGGEFELNTDDLDYVFRSTEPEDSARTFWADVVYAGGAADHVISLGDCHTALIAMLEERLADGSRASQNGCEPPGHSLKPSSCSYTSQNTKTCREKV